MTDEIDLEGMEDVEPAVIEAIKAGVKRSDPGIHPDLNSPSHPVPRPPDATEGETGWMEKIKQKITEITKRDPEIYPLF